MRWTLPAILGVLVVDNVLVNRVLPGWAYLPCQLATVITILALARRGGVRVGSMYLSRDRVRRGLCWGLVLLSATAAVLLIVRAFPASTGWFRDRRVKDSTWALLAYHGMLRIPLGTALTEEIAFRSVLPAAIEHHPRLRVAAEPGVPSWRADVLASVAFGFWHISPGLNISTVNEAVGEAGTSPVARLVGVVFAVVGTTVVGCCWCWLRRRSGHVVTTILAHAASNSFAYAMAFWAWRR